MKKVIITGGSGTVGTGFIKEFYDTYQFYSLSKNSVKQDKLKNKFPNVTLINESVENTLALQSVFKKIRPDIVIHAAAIKNISITETNPTKAIQANVLGSLNVVDAAKNADVKITIGISSDKACARNTVYGQTKYLMERVFLEANTNKNKFLCCRLGNVAGSDGSVIPTWLDKAKKNQALQLTDIKMNRFMASVKDIARLIQKSIKVADQAEGGFVIFKKNESR